MSGQSLFVKPSHPALFATDYPTPPHTPVSPILNAPPVSAAPPNPSNAMLRQHHAYALKYVIAKLRWEQLNNDYLRGEDAWLNHNMMIQKLEQELHDVEAAQKGLDPFPMAHAPMEFPKPHGPLSKEQYEQKKAEELEKERKLDEKLYEKFPFVRQLFIGPLTKNQARNFKMAKDQLLEGDLEQISLLLPEENVAMLNAMHGMHGAKPHHDKKSYEQQRYEKEQAKIAALHPAAPRKVPRIGPMTHEEYLRTVPVYGPQTKSEAMLQAQRDQRQLILTWLRQPWDKFDPEAALLLEKLGRLALKKLEAERQAAKAGGAGAKDDKARDRKEAPKKAEARDPRDVRYPADVKQVKEVRDKDVKDVKKEKDPKALKDVKKIKDVKDVPKGGNVQGVKV